MSSEQFTYAVCPAIERMAVLHARMQQFTYDRHLHEEYALGVTIAGSQHFTTGRGPQSSQVGNVMLFNPEEAHDGRAGIGEPLQYAMVYLHQDLLFPLLREAGVADPASFRFSMNVTEHAGLRQVTRALCERVAKARCDVMEVEHLLFQLALQLGQGMRQAPSRKEGDGLGAPLRRARDMMADQCEEALSLDDVSTVAGLSKYHFLRLFKQRFGMTPHHFLMNCRLNNARAALQSGSPPTDVAAACGFYDLSHLNRYFKRTYGLTPHQYQSNVLGRSEKRAC